MSVRATATNTMKIIHRLALTKNGVNYGVTLGGTWGTFTGPALCNANDYRSEVNLTPLPDDAQELPALIQYGTGYQYRGMQETVMRRLGDKWSELGVRLVAINNLRGSGNASSRTFVADEIELLRGAKTQVYKTKGIELTGILNVICGPMTPQTPPAGFTKLATLESQVKAINTAHWSEDYKDAALPGDHTLRRRLAERLPESLKPYVEMGEYGPCAKYGFKAVLPN